MKVYSGSAWVTAFVSLSGALIAANNLSDLTNTTTARTNLGLGSIATQAASSVTITGGSINGATVGATTAAAGTFTSITAPSATITGGNIDGTTIGATTAAAGTFSSVSTSSATITGGSINGTTIGATTPSTITGTTGTFSGNLTVDTNTLFVDAANNRVGVGTITPAQALDVIGTIKGDTFIVGGETLLMPTSSALTTLSGSSVDFTGIPSTARRVTVMVNELSTNGTSVPLIQLGDAGGIETSGYVGTIALTGTSSMAGANFSAGVSLSTSFSGAAFLVGSVTFNLMDAATNRWVISGALGRSDGGQLHSLGGTKALSATLTQVRITTNSANTFDSGTASVSWE